MGITATTHSSIEAKSSVVCCQCFGTGKQRVMQCVTRTMIRTGSFNLNDRDNVVTCPQCEGSGKSQP